MHNSRHRYHLHQSEEEVRDWSPSWTALAIQAIGLKHIPCSSPAPHQHKQSVSRWETCRQVASALQSPIGLCNLQDSLGFPYPPNTSSSPQHPLEAKAPSAPIGRRAFLVNSPLQQQQQYKHQPYQLVEQAQAKPTPVGITDPIGRSKAHTSQKNWMICWI